MSEYKPSAGTFSLNEFDFSKFGTDRSRIVTGKVVPAVKGKPGKTTCDPSKRGFFKIQIEGVNDEIDPVYLPWAIPIHSIGTGGRSVSKFCVPAPGTRVVAVQGADEYTYFVLGEHPSESRCEVNRYSEDYPDSWGMSDRSGNWTHVNMKKGYAKFCHSSGCKATMCGTGTVNLKCVDDMNMDVYEKCRMNIGDALKINVGDSAGVKISEVLILTVGSDCSIQIGGNANISVGGETNLTCPKTNINSEVEIDGNLKVNGNISSDNVYTSGNITARGNLVAENVTAISNVSAGGKCCCC